jgi:hypothetical protein
MDIKCPKCGEAWDIDSLHDFIEEQFPSKPWYDTNGKYDQKEYGRIFDNTYANFRLVGCNALNAKHYYGEDGKQKANPAIGMILDLMGEDVDAAASLIEDFGL